MTGEPINNSVEGAGFTGAHYVGVLRHFRWHSRISLHFGKNLHLNAKPKARKTPSGCVKRHQKYKQDV